jgi:ABC-type antimicrobial peptide transport system permease subunit
MWDKLDTEHYSILVAAKPSYFAIGFLCVACFMAVAQFAAYRKIKTLDLLEALKNRG